MTHDLSEEADSGNKVSPRVAEGHLTTDQLTCTLSPVIRYQTLRSIFEMKLSKGHCANLVAGVDLAREDDVLGRTEADKI